MRSHKKAKTRLVAGVKVVWESCCMQAANKLVEEYTYKKGKRVETGSLVCAALITYIEAMFLKVSKNFKAFVNSEFAFRSRTA